MFAVKTVRLSYRLTVHWIVQICRLSLSLVYDIVKIWFLLTYICKDSLALRIWTYLTTNETWNPLLSSIRVYLWLMKKKFHKKLTCEKDFWHEDFWKRFLTWRFLKKIFDTKIFEKDFWHKDFWHEDFWKRFLTQRFLTQRFLTLKFLEKILTRRFLKKNFDPKIFDTKIFEKDFWHEDFWKRFLTLVLIILVQFWAVWDLT